MTIRIPRWLLIGAGALIIAGAAAFATVTVFGGGGEDAQAEAASTEADQRAEELATAQRAADKCEQQLGGFLDTLEELDSRLAVGLTMDEYSRQVGNIQVEYDRVPFGALGAECVTAVGIDTEGALNAYAKAQNVWADCFDTLSCDTDSIDPDLQAQWSKATNLVSNARHGLAAMARP